MLDSFLELLLTEAPNYAQDAEPICLVAPTPNQTVQAQAMESQSIFDEFFTREQPASPSSGSLETEVTQVLAWQNTESPKPNPIQFWALRPPSTLRSYAQALLSIPASSAPVERVFSVGGNIITPRRNQLSSSMLSKLMVIKCNNMYNSY